MQWYGGKWEMADWLASLLPRDAQTFVMPFGGAGSPLWHVEPYPVEVYNDLDGELVNFFRQCRDNGDELARRLELTPFARSEFESCKALDATDPIERARQFAYVARASHGGRWGSSWSRAIGHSRRGMSSSVSRFLHMPETVVQVASRLKTVQIESMDAVELIREYDRPETLFYLDPPYVAKTRNGADVYRCEMTDAQHAELLATLKQCKGRWLLSGYANELYDTALAGYERIEREVSCRSNITAKGASSKPTRTEIAWASYSTTTARNANSTEAA